MKNHINWHARRVFENAKVSVVILHLMKEMNSVIWGFLTSYANDNFI